MEHQITQMLALVHGKENFVSHVKHKEVEFKLESSQMVFQIIAIIVHKLLRLNRILISLHGGNQISLLIQTHNLKLKMKLTQKSVIFKNQLILKFQHLQVIQKTDLLN